MALYSLYPSAKHIKERVLSGALSLSVIFAVTPQAFAADDVAPQAAISLTNTPAAADTAFEIQWLSAKDKDLYRDIFRLQDGGSWHAADALIKKLDNKILLGHVQYQRYMHPTKYRSTYKELKDWLANYGDHPSAWTVYRLALTRRGRAANPQRPDPVGFPSMNDSVHSDPVNITALSTPRSRSKADRAKIRNTENLVRREMKRGNPDQAEKYFWAMERLDILSNVEHDQLLTRIAGSHFFAGNDEKAYALASSAADRSREAFGQADWIAGLTAWRMGQCDRAATHFASLAQSKTAGSWTQAAGAYWAARSYLACGHPEKVSAYLLEAASHSTTFYGLIAARQLGIDPHYDWSMNRLSQGEFDSMIAIPGIGRAVALSELGETARADQELRNVWGRHGESLREQLIRLAGQLNLPATQSTLARVGPSDSKAPLSALYPLPQWQPDGGFKIDRALMFAIMRQESNFRPNANSNVGAVGLMQVMPQTASFIMKDRSLSRDREKLMDPATNLKVSQRYMQHLMEIPVAGEDLFKFAVAYNGGPGNLKRWQRKMKASDDPLLFIESIPARETRNYIEHILTNLWMYRSRLGQAAPSLDAIAQGAWPTYEALDDESLLQAGQPLETSQHAQNR